jgi:predicted Zn finger-like uncharacterized protein
MTISCPACGSRFKVGEDLIGKKAKCGACQNIFVVPEQGDVAKELSSTRVTGSPDARDLAWTSLYLGGLAALLLLFRGGLGGLTATLIFALAVESAAVFFAFRGWRDARLAWGFQASHLARTGMLVNGVLLALVALSVVLTLYQLIAGPGAGGGGMGDLQKVLGQYNDVLKQLQP